MENNPKEVYLQILTSDYSIRRGQVFAYGFIESSPLNTTYSVQIKNEPYDPNFFHLLIEKLEVWTKAKTKIYTFNGLNEWKIFQKENKSMDKFYHTHTIDLFLLAKKYKYFSGAKSFSLASLAQRANYHEAIFLSKEIYEKTFPYDNTRDRQWIKDSLYRNLEAMRKIYRDIEELQKSLIHKGKDYSIEISNVQKDTQKFIISGVVFPPQSIFFHEEAIYFEEKAQGTFRLEIEILEVNYDKDIQCYTLKYPYPVTNPKSMPQGYMLFGLEGKIYIDQIYTIIEEILYKVL